MQLDTGFCPCRQTARALELVAPFFFFSGVQVPACPHRERKLHDDVAGPKKKIGHTSHSFLYWLHLNVSLLQQYMAPTGSTW